MNEYHFPIVCGRWDNGGLDLCTNSRMYARMYVHVDVQACMCVRLANDYQCQHKNKIVDFLRGNN